MTRDLGKPIGRLLIFTPSQCAELCAANPEAVLELAANRTLIGMTPIGGSTGARKIGLLASRQNLAAICDLCWIALASASGLPLADGSVCSPDASLLVVELASPSDEPQALRREMVASIANGSALGWLLLPLFRTVKMWKPGAPETADSPLLFCDPKRLEPSPLFPGQVIDRAGFGEL